jgi:hypothetical protein
LDVGNQFPGRVKNMHVKSILITSHDCISVNKPLELVMEYLLGMGMPELGVLALSHLCRKS